MTPERRSEDVRLARVEERLVRMEERVETCQRDVSFMRSDMHKLVTQVEFNPIKMAVYGLIAIMLAAVVGALVALVVRTPIQ